MAGALVVSTNLAKWGQLWQHDILLYAQILRNTRFWIRINPMSLGSPSQKPTELLCLWDIYIPNSEVARCV